MDLDHDARTSLIVLETGAGWPDFITDFQRNAPNSVVEAQSATESALDFAARVTRRIRRFGELRFSAVLAANSQNGEVLDARRQVTRAILAAMPTGSELLLTTQRALGESAVGQELFELAGELADDMAAREIGVRVRFSDAPRQSSIMPVARTLGDIRDFDAAVGDESAVAD